MSDKPSPTDEEQRFEEGAAQYHDLLIAGAAPDRRSFVMGHPDLAPLHLPVLWPYPLR